MATVTNRPARAAGRRGRPTGTFELHAWFFMRVSGLALVVLALVHWTIMHFMNRLSVENSQWIVARYQNVFWPTFDAVMLLFAMLHGTNGTRMLIDDFIRGRTANMLAKGILYTVSFVFIVLGLITIFMLPNVKF
jgi:succinate dehydrogenase / fumarate reductase membrane anchor subunit